jgi:hypothetical protein
LPFRGKRQNDSVVVILGLAGLNRQSFSVRRKGVFRFRRRLSSIF